MEEYHIVDLPDILKNRFQNKEIKNINIKKLPLKGYGSIVLKIDFTTKNKNDGTEEKVYAVGKILPPSEERREFFNVQVSFRNEVHFYQEVIPTLRALQAEIGPNDPLDIFADFYGARIDLNGDKRVTEHAILVLENLIEAGFKNIDSTVGFDLQSAKVLLNDLAKLHGTTIALKYKKPKIYEKFKENYFTFDFSQPDSRRFLDGPVTILQENPECAPLIPLITAFYNKTVSAPREPYACICHCDMWTNNTMQKFENGKAVKNRFLDFQIMDIRSCASDLFFFLWTSVQQSVLEKHIDDLLKFYHDNLVKTVKDLNCDISSFNLDKFYKELQIEAEYEFGHCMMFVFRVRGPGLSEDLENEAADLPKSNDSTTTLPLALKEYIWYMTLECRRRGWLY